MGDTRPSCIQWRTFSSLGTWGPVVIKNENLSLAFSQFPRKAKHLKGVGGGKKNQQRESFSGETLPVTRIRRSVQINLIQAWQKHRWAILINSVFGILGIHSFLLLCNTLVPSSILQVCLIAVSIIHTEHYKNCSPRYLEGIRTKKDGFTYNRKTYDEQLYSNSYILTQKCLM